MNLTDADLNNLRPVTIDLGSKGPTEMVRLVDVEAIVARHVAAAVQATTERVQALADEWQAELDSGAIRDENARYCWGIAVREVRAALAGSTDPTPDTRIKAEALREAADAERAARQDYYTDPVGAAARRASQDAEARLRARAGALDPTHPDKAVES